MVKEKFNHSSPKFNVELIDYDPPPFAMALYRSKEEELYSCDLIPHRHSLPR